MVATLLLRMTCVYVVHVCEQWWLALNIILIYYFQQYLLFHIIIEIDCYINPGIVVRC